MVSKAQLRILTWLSKHPDNVKNSWDVSRELSLPGIAEGLGVVRSALNVPLTKLEQEVSSPSVWLMLLAVVIGADRFTT